ncbi:glycosyltransferase 87 family protein [Streptacidiphilus jiangxiensis]|uniref:Alpha-1,2-mannosyltransferase n=1 Tax=Streptacidiphilus jiangxiensis TaxID=235985 RepID=A0A1H7PNY1_STRJI|nr:glycosyltransferase 87 family protein [Streptacidiphilus jiangxiensis]SEL37483.1 alpha-1,2-mannosyltransferase [Streptacidiphilus jiangxiensis]
MTARRVAIVAASLAFAAALGLWLWCLFHWSDGELRQMDLQVYLKAGQSLPGGERRLYLLQGGPAGLPYLYPPFAAMVFWLSPPFAVAQVLLLGLSVAAVVLVSWCGLRLAGGGRPGVAAVLACTAAALWLAPVQETLRYGQLNLLLLAPAAVDWCLPDGHRLKGVLLGLTAGIKLTPALFLAHYLCTGRRSAGLRGLATFAGTALLGLVLLPHASLAYWPQLSGLAERAHRMLLMATPIDQAVASFAVRVVADTAQVRAVGGVLGWVAAAIGLGLAVLLHRRGREAAGLVVVSVAALLMEPMSWVHHWVWALLPALGLLVVRARRGHWSRWLAPVLGCLLFGAWPPGWFRPIRGADWPGGLTWASPLPNARTEPVAAVLDFLCQNLYVLSGLALLVAVPVWLLVTSRRAATGAPVIAPRAEATAIGIRR